MKVIIAGSTGFVATELIRQALAHPKVTSIIVLGRREISLPPNAEAKLKSIICRDFENYSDSIKAELAEADACIWTIAVTPSKSKLVAWEEVCKISRDYAVTAIETISQLRHDRPTSRFRFVYISGVAAERDPSKKPLIMGDYCLMRGEAETRILKCAQESKGTVEACVVKPGLIEDSSKTGMLTKAVRSVGTAVLGLPKVDLQEISAALLDQVINGFDKDTLENEDLVRIGQRSLTEQRSS
ncbi:hypothetical protein ANO14919_043880 [Xylariales sp. No.14919]|nr:hypothetical protein ANO14919_043880 [Xylariales sp. No.14919]